MAIDLTGETHQAVPMLFFHLFLSLGTSAPPSSTPIEFCRNGGTWENGRCICTEEWKGLRCTIGKLLGVIRV
jgi:hypothetical protein